LQRRCVFQDHYDDDRGKTMFQKTTPHLQDQDQDQDRFLVSDQSCPKTDGLRPHHCFTVTNIQTVAFISADTYVRIS